MAKREAGLAPSTVRTIYPVLRGAQDVAVRNGPLRRNPAPPPNGLPSTAGTPPI